MVAWAQAATQMRTTSGHTNWGAAVTLATVVALVLGFAVLAFGQSTSTVASSPPRTAPPSAVDSPNICLLGSGSRSWCGDDGKADRAKLAAPSDVAVAEDGGVLIADTLNNVVRRELKNGHIVPIVGTGEEGSVTAGSRPAAKVGLNGPRGVTAVGGG